MTKHSFPVAALAALALLPGCGGGPKLVPVTGTVTLNDEPLPGATVLFNPGPGTDEATVGQDLTGPEGNFRIMTRGRAGLAPGNYSVVVTKEVYPSASKGAGPPLMMEGPGGRMVEDTGMQEVERGLGAGSGGAAAPVKVEENSDREVTAKGDVFDFDVKATAQDVEVLRSDG